MEKSRVVAAISADMAFIKKKDHEIRWLVENSRLPELLDHALSTLHPATLCIGVKDANGAYLGSIIVSVQCCDGRLTGLMYKFYDFPRSRKRPWVDALAPAPSRRQPANAMRSGSGLRCSLSR